MTIWASSLSAPLWMLLDNLNFNIENFNLLGESAVWFKSFYLLAIEKNSNPLMFSSLFIMPFIAPISSVFYLINVGAGNYLMCFDDHSKTY